MRRSQNKLENKSIHYHVNNSIEINRSNLNICQEFKMSIAIKTAHNGQIFKMGQSVPNLTKRFANYMMIQLSFSGSSYII